MASHYLNGPRFTALCRDGIPTDELIEMFYALADRHYEQHPLRRFVPRDDARQEAALRCISIVGNFREKVRGAAYNYFRSVIHHLFCDMVKQARRLPPTGGGETDTAVDWRIAAQKKYRQPRK